MRTLRDLELNRLTVRPDELVTDAMAAMQRDGVAAAGVVDDTGFRGLITLEASVLSDSLTTVGEIMRTHTSRLEASDLVRAVAKTFIVEQADFLPVYEDEEYVGLVSSLDLVTELGRSWDPLTGLSWSDRLREWGVDTLQSGNEVGIVFFDLNDFGAYNKRFGHAVGDAVLRGFARHLATVTDPGRDVLVRFGGDEFAIGTTRTRSEIDEMLRPLGDKTFFVKGIKEPVDYAIGLSGGKRTQEPSREHVAATLDNLINLASKACLASKPAHLGVSLNRATKAPITVSVTHSDDMVTVQARDGSLTGEGTVLINQDRYRAIAQAAAEAAGALDGSDWWVADTVFYLDESQPMVTISGRRTVDGKEHPFVSEMPLEQESDADLAKSVLKVSYAGIGASDGTD